MAAGYSLTRDISPPTRIPDFSLLEQDLSSLSISLSWSAPGGDYDTGKGDLNIFSPLTAYMLTAQSALHILLLFGQTRLSRAVFQFQ